MDSIAIGRRGYDALDRGLPYLRAIERLDIEFVPELENGQVTIPPRDFVTAAFAAMKEVDFQVRTRAGLDDSHIGVKLMVKRFGTSGCPVAIRQKSPIKFAPARTSASGCAPRPATRTLLPTMAADFPMRLGSTIMSIVVPMLSWAIRK